MIERIVIENFKSFRKIDLKLGNLNIFIGANASGKSNFFDALRVLQGIGYGFTIDEILNGKPKSASGVEWESIRGGSLRALFQNGSNQDGLCTFEVKLKTDSDADYRIAFSPEQGRVSEEKLKCPFDVYDSNPDAAPKIANRPNDPGLTARYFAGTRGRQPHLSFEKNRPILHQLGRKTECTEKDRQMLEKVALALSDMQRIDPSPAMLRDYSRAHQIGRMG